MEQPIFKIEEKKVTKTQSSFVLSPLEAGYGQTLGVGLRRVLLTSLPGAAITKVRIAGVKHRFSTLKGVREDIIEFLLNLKKVRLIYEGKGPVSISLSAEGTKEVKAADLEVPANVEVANPDLVITHLTKGAKISAKMEVESGTGWQSAEERETAKIGEIPLDATFSPVLLVNYKVEETRVGRLTNYDKLTMEITTDGTITPKEALIKAAKTLSLYLSQIISPKKVKKEPKEPKEDSLGAVGRLSVEEIGLPTRVANALVKTGYETVEKLVKADREELMKVRNLGEKSVKIVAAALGEKGVEF